jgi:hypothetical protein
MSNDMRPMTKVIRNPNDETPFGAIIPIFFWRRHSRISAFLHGLFRRGRQIQQLPDSIV